jgi:hypothetical protein
MTSAGRLLFLGREADGALWTVCGDKRFLQGREEGAYGITFVVVKDPAHCQDGQVTAEAMKHYQELREVEDAAREARATPDAGGLAPGDDLDGDGWLDDPCTDEGVPLDEEC